MHACLPVQDHIKEAVQSNQEAAALVEAQSAAAATLLAAKGVAAVKQEAVSRATDAAAAASKILDNPPPPLRLTAQCADGADHLRTTTLEQLVDYTPADTKARVYPSLHACLPCSVSASAGTTRGAGTTPRAGATAAAENG